ncbi:hypothetical protein PAMP_014921 [Pampus punctatissimus]
MAESCFTSLLGRLVVMATEASPPPRCHRTSAPGSHIAPIILTCCSLSHQPQVAVRHVKVKPRCAVLTMLKRLDKIRFRGPRTRDDFPDLAESPPASDNECSDDMLIKPRAAPRDTEELLRDPPTAKASPISQH